MGEIESISKVKAVRLDNLIHNLGLNRIDFLKIDAEGAEPEVLEGAKDFLNNIRKIAVDCTPERFGKTTSSKVNDILSSQGFQTRVRNDKVYGWRE